MPPLRVSFAFDDLRQEFEAIGIHLLEEFPDGDTRWGDSPMAKPYKGLSVVIHPYISLSPGERRYDIFSIRNAVMRLGKKDRLAELEAGLEKQLFKNDTN